MSAIPPIPRLAARPARGFTLIELLVVVAILAILAAVAVPNFFLATNRALMAANAGNYHAIATALQAYLVDFGTLPPADTEAGPYSSFGPEFNSIRNGPAAGGSHDGLPWILYERGYLTDWKALFCPVYLREFKGGTTLRGEWPRYHNFRYAYQSAGLGRGGHTASGTSIMTGETWLVRDLDIGPRNGFFGRYAPNYPADYHYPWGENRDREMVMYADFAPRMVLGGTDQPAENQ